MKKRRNYGVILLMFAFLIIIFINTVSARVHTLEIYAVNNTNLTNNTGNNWCNGSDINKDSKVDATDLNSVLSYYNQNCSALNSWCNGSDINKDSKVDATDLNSVLSYYNKDCTPRNFWCNGTDITHDGKVNFSDLGEILANYNRNDCRSITCFKNSDCGLNSSSKPYCLGKTLCTNLSYYICNNPGTLISSCKNNFITTCNPCLYGCSNAICNTVPKPLINPKNKIQTILAKLFSRLK